MSLAGRLAACQPHSVDGGLPPVAAPTFGGLTAISGDSVANREFYAGTLALRATTCARAPQMMVQYLAPGAGCNVELNFVTCDGAVPGRPGAGMGHRLVWTTLSRQVFSDWQSRLVKNGCALEERDEALHFCDPDGLRHELLVIGDAESTSHERAARLRAVRVYSEDRQTTARRLAKIVHGQDAPAPAEAAPLGGLIVDDAPPIPGRLGAGSIHHVIWKLTGENPAQARLPSSELELVGSDKCAEHRRLYARGPGGLLLVLDADPLGKL